MVRFTVVESTCPCPSSPYEGDAIEYRRNLCGLPLASTPGGITPKLCPQMKFPASAVLETSITRCRMNPAALFDAVHRSFDTTTPTPGAFGGTRCILASCNTGVPGTGALGIVPSTLMKAFLGQAH